MEAGRHLDRGNNVMADPLDQVKEDIRDLKEWASQHDREHTADTELLASIVGSLKSHEGNHHGTTSTIKQGGAVGIGVTLLYVAVELIQRFLI